MVRMIGAFSPVVERGDAVAVGLVERPDHDAVGVEEVGDRRALLQELGVGAVADVLQPAGVQLGPDALAGADRHGALHHQDVAGVGADALELLHHAHHAREVRVARVGRRRVHGDEDDVRALEHALERERVGQPARVLGHQLGEAGLVDRDLAVVERRDLGGVDVAQRDVEALGGQADAGHQADVSRADDADALRHRAVLVAHRAVLSRRHRSAVPVPSGSGVSTARVLSMVIGPRPVPRAPVAKW